MKRYLPAIVASVVIAFGLPTAGTFALPTAPIVTMQGDSVGSVPSVTPAPTVYETSWKGTDGLPHKVTTTRNPGETGSAHAKRHKQDVEDLAAQYPPAPNQTVPFWAGHHADGSEYEAHWRAQIAGGSVRVSVTTYAADGETLDHIKLRFQHDVIALAHEMPQG